MLAVVVIVVVLVVVVVVVVMLDLCSRLIKPYSSGVSIQIHARYTAAITVYNTTTTTITTTTTTTTIIIITTTTFDLPLLSSPTPRLSTSLIARWGASVCNSRWLHL